MWHWPCYTHAHRGAAAYARQYLPCVGAECRVHAGAVWRFMRSVRRWFVWPVPTPERRHVLHVLLRYDHLPSRHAPLPVCRHDYRWIHDYRWNHDYWWLHDGWFHDNR